MEATIPPHLHADPVLREKLLSFFLEGATGAELADLLRDMRQDARGTVDERRQRARANTEFLTMPPDDFAGLTRDCLAAYTAGHFADLCEDLGLRADGNKDALYRRVMREVHLKEGWVPSVSRADPTAVTVENIAPYLAWMPLTTRGEYEKDFYPAIEAELDEVFGNVYRQIAVAHGTTLKIDFHIGDPQGDGVGVEVKMPANTSDVHRALGQIDHYQRRYGKKLIVMVLVLTDLLKPEVERSFREDLVRKDVGIVVRAV